MSRYCLQDLILLINSHSYWERLERSRKLDFCGVSQGQVSGYGNVIFFHFPYALPHLLSI